MAANDKLDHVYNRKYEQQFNLDWFGEYDSDKAHLKYSKLGYLTQL